MDNVSDGMQSLCDDIIAGHDSRKITLNFVKDDSNTIRGDARLFIGQCRILRRQRANALSKELAEYRKAMVPAVHVFLQTCRHRRTETRSDLLGASRAWSAMASALKERRGKSTES